MRILIPVNKTLAVVAVLLGGCTLYGGDDVEPSADAGADPWGTHWTIEGGRRGGECDDWPADVVTLELDVTTGHITAAGLDAVCEMTFGEELWLAECRTGDMLVVDLQVFAAERTGDMVMFSLGCPFSPAAYDISVIVE